MSHPNSIFCPITRASTATAIQYGRDKLPYSVRALDLSNIYNYIMVASHILHTCGWSSSNLLVLFKTVLRHKKRVIPLQHEATSIYAGTTQVGQQVPMVSKGVHSLPGTSRSAVIKAVWNMVGSCDLSGSVPLRRSDVFCRVFM